MKNNFNCDKIFDSCETPELYLETLFNMTDEHNILHLRDFPTLEDYENGNESQSIYSCKMQWERAEIAEILSSFNDIYKKLQTLSNNLDFETQKDKAEAEIENVLGDFIAAKKVKLYAMRIFRLLGLGAPNVVLNTECKLFIKAMVFEKYVEKAVLINE